MSDLSFHPFSPESVALEGGALTRSEITWMRWAAQLESIMGINPLETCSQDVDGVSLDYAFMHFAAGLTAQEAASRFYAEMRCGDAA